MRTTSGTRTRSIVRVLVLEDGPEWVEHIQRFLEDWVEEGFLKLEFVDSVSVAKQKLSLSAKYHLVLLDLVLPDGDGLEFLRWMRKSIYAGRVIVYTVRGNHHTLNALAAFEGVRTLIKPATEIQFKACIASCITTPDRIDAVVAELIAEHDLSPRAGDDSRIAEVLRERAHGLSDVQVCEKLGIAEGTYRKHREHILAKTGDDTMSDLVIRILLRATGLG